MENGRWKVESGFTLPEVITVTVVAVIIGGLVLGIMIQNTRVFVSESSKVSQGLNSNDALEQIKSEIKQSSAVAASYTSSGITYTSGINTLVLQIPAVDSSGNSIDSVFDYGVFTVSSGNLLFKIFTDPLSKRVPVDQILAKNVNQISFKYLDLAGDVIPTGAIKVKVALILQQRIGVNFQTSISTTEANLRND